MFNTMTVTKAAGAFIGALLFLMLANWAASALFHVGPAGHGGSPLCGVAPLRLLWQPLPKTNVRGGLLLRAAPL